MKINLGVWWQTHLHMCYQANLFELKDGGCSDSRDERWRLWFIVNGGYSTNILSGLPGTALEGHLQKNRPDFHWAPLQKFPHFNHNSIKKQFDFSDGGGWGEIKSVSGDDRNYIKKYRKYIDQGVHWWKEETVTFYRFRWFQNREYNQQMRDLKDLLEYCHKNGLKPWELTEAKKWVANLKNIDIEYQKLDNHKYLFRGCDIIEI